MTAFLSMQTASAHIHLAEHHNHEGVHSHEVESHAHNLTSHYTETMDLSHQVDASNTIDLNSSFNAPSGHQQLPDLAIVQAYFQPRIPAQIVKVDSRLPVIFPYGHLDRSTGTPRAPPFFS
ncbi:MAG: hypothetical protein ACQEQR_05845 [Pseudomonadota bacterium]